MKGEISVSRTS